jgi:hypothetical protein
MFPVVPPVLTTPHILRVLSVLIVVENCTPGVLPKDCAADDREVWALPPKKINSPVAPEVLYVTRNLLPPESVLYIFIVNSTS